MKRERSKEKSPGDKTREFYARVLDDAEQLDFELAEGIDGIDGEIALLRVKIKSLLEEAPADMDLVVKMSNTLLRMIKMKYQMDKASNKGLREAIYNVLKDVALPLGIGIGTAVRK